MALTKKKKIATIVSVVLAVIVVLLLAAYFGVGAFFYSIALNPKNNSLKHGDAQTPKQEWEHDFDEHNEWFDNSGYTTVSMTSSDKRSYKLNAYQLLQPIATDKWVVAIHGYRGNALTMRYQAYCYYQMGFNVLMPDLRGHGLSEGDYIGMGWHDSGDILDWINKQVVGSNPQAEIAIYGVSMGAATTMMTTGLDLPNNVKVAIADCGYTNVYEQFAYVMKNAIKLPKEPIMSAANIITNINAGYDLKKADSISRLQKSKTPTLFIHGDKDDFVPYYMLDKVYNACAAKDKRKLTIAGAAHAQSAIVNHELYWGELQRFVSQYI